MKYVFGTTQYDIYVSDPVHKQRDTVSLIPIGHKVSKIL